MDFLKQNKEFTKELLTHNKILNKSLNRLISTSGGKNDVTETDPVDSTDVTTDPDFHYNGINVMSIPREKNASTFGRKLGQVLFGDKDECDRMNAMMSPGKDQENASRNCCDDKKTIFARVVKKKDPKSPEAAYAAAREAANQMGRELEGSIFLASLVLLKVAVRINIHLNCHDAFLERSMYCFSLSCFSFGAYFD